MDKLSISHMSISFFKLPVWNKGFFCPRYACIMDMSLKVIMYNGHVLEGKLCITDMYLKVNNFIPDMNVKVSHV